MQNTDCCTCHCILPWVLLEKIAEVEVNKFNIGEESFLANTHKTQANLGSYPQFTRDYWTDSKRQKNLVGLHLPFISNLEGQT